jgi:hypothetical protein
MLVLPAKAWKHVFEIRYPASPLLFDKRGKLLEQFKGEPFTGWSIDKNRIDLYNQEQSISVFAGFNNAGGSAEDPPTFTYYKDHIQRWLKLIIPEISIQKINRIGLRTFYLAQVNDLTFEKLFSSFLNSYLKTQNGLWGFSNAKPTDIGITLDAIIDKQKLHIVTGPMEHKQAKSLFECESTKKKIPPLSVFVDIDYFMENAGFDSSTLVQAIMKFFIEAQNDCDVLASELLKNLDLRGT